MCFFIMLIKLKLDILLAILVNSANLSRIPPCPGKVFQYLLFLLFFKNEKNKSPSEMIQI